jgi:release factor glutamine methyltransferase
MTIKEIYQLFRRKLLSVYSENEAENISRMVFESLANISRSDIITHPDEILEAETNIKLERALKDLLNYKPVQYILGNSSFYYLLFKVNEAVLIPRPETEELVTAVIHFLKNNPYKKIVEIGTGSGCIPVSIKKNIPEADITSLDISQSVLSIAKENAVNNHAEINLIELDFLNEKYWHLLGIYDVIVSNPPYIPQREYASIDNHVKLFEPSTALFVPNSQPLLFYEKITAFAEEHLTANGKIFVEIHENFGNQVSELFSTNGFSVELIKDMYEKDRIVIATRNP